MTTTNDAIVPAATPPPGTDTVSKWSHSPETIKIALAIMEHRFPPTDDGRNRGPGDPNSKPYLVLPGTGLGGNRVDLPSHFLQFALDMNREGKGRKKGPFKKADALEQLMILSRKWDTVIDALESAGDEVGASVLKVFTSWGPSILPTTASTPVTPRRSTRSSDAALAAVNANGRTPKATNRQGGAQAPEDDPTSFNVTQTYAALSALFNGTTQLLLSNLPRKNNASLRKVISNMAALFDEVLPSAKAIVGIKSGGTQIGTVLGEGSFGQVRRGTLTTSFEETLVVAVKEFKISEDQSIEIIEEEIRLLSVMGSFPCFPTVLGHKITPNFAAMVMDFMDGGILDDIDRQLSEEEVKTFSRQIIGCLMVMHAMDVCHRDIKPENVGLKTDADGNLKAYVLDLGLGRRGANEATTMAGTPGYMAPEVHAGNNVGTYDGITADVWSAGVTILELAVSAETFIEIKRSKRPDGSYDVLLFKRKIQEAGHSNELANLVAWMLTVDPTKRPSPLQAYEHAAFKNMESLFESQLEDWAWVPTVLQDKKIKQQQAAEITSLKETIAQIQSNYDARLAEFAVRATAAEAALANENDPNNAAAAAGDDDDDADPNAAAAAAAAAGDAGEDVDGANPGGFTTAAQKAIVRGLFNDVSRGNLTDTNTEKLLAVYDRLNGNVTFPCTHEQVKEYVTQGDPNRPVPKEIMTEAHIHSLKCAGANNAIDELRDFLGHGPKRTVAKNQDALIGFYGVYW